MTLVQGPVDPIQRVFELTAMQGLIPRDETPPVVPRIADVRRLRRLMPVAWTQLSDKEKLEIYQVFQQRLTSKIPPYQLLSTLPQVVRAITHIVRAEGKQGLFNYARTMDVEITALQQEVVSLWENDHPAFVSRVQQAAIASSVDRGKRVQSRDDVRAILDDLF